LLDALADLPDGYLGQTSPEPPPPLGRKPGLGPVDPLQYPGARHGEQDESSQVKGDAGNDRDQPAKNTGDETQYGGPNQQQAFQQRPPGPPDLEQGWELGVSHVNKLQVSPEVTGDCCHPVPTIGVNLLSNR
jgi:hypothetical protein